VYSGLRAPPAALYPFSASSLRRRRETIVVFLDSKQVQVPSTEIGRPPRQAEAARSGSLRSIDLQ
jgi:hypothetical protein